MQKILITGSNGFLGSYLKRTLDSLKLVSYNRFDKTDFDPQLIKGIIHCAGLAHNSHNPSLYEKYYKANFLFTKEIASLIPKENLNFFIFISTAKVTEWEFTSDLGLNKSNASIYVQTKKIAENYLLENLSHTKVFILRPSVIIGPKAKGNIGFLEKLIKCKIPILIPKTTSRNTLTDIRNLKTVIEHLCLNHQKLETGIYNIVDDKKLYLDELLIKLARSRGLKIFLIKIPTKLYKFMLEISSLINPEISGKLKSVFFNQFEVSDNSIKKIIKLKHNSFE